MTDESGPATVERAGQPITSFTLQYVVPPVLVWAAAAILLRLIAAATGFSPFDRQLMVRWDSVHYLSIAKAGYRLYVSDGTDGYLAGTWAGNTGWMPAYPLVLRAFSGLGVSAEVSGAVISAAFCLATLLALWRMMLRRNPQSGVAPLCLAAFIPAYVYCFAVFPISMATFFAVLTLAALVRRRWWAAGMSGALMAFTYATGLLVAGVAVLWLVFGTTGLAWRERAKAMLIAGGVPWSGVAAVAVMHQVVVHKWNAFLLIQQRYGHGLHNPIRTLLTFLEVLHWPDLAWVSAGVCIALVAVIVFAAVAKGIERWRTIGRADQLLLIYLGVFWLFPLVMGPQASRWRAMVLLLPASALATRLSRVVGWTLVGLFLVAGASITFLFFRGDIV